MTLDFESCYRALASRDRRFDGRFFVGVRTTGIYCRPVCKAKLPARTSCTFYATHEGAEAAGYRPCKLCRPELAPGGAPVDAVGDLARTALTLIRHGALDEGSVASLASELGTSVRHLNRSLVQEIGAGPLRIALTRRLLLAKRLLTDTDLPVGEVAMAAGFGSLRRFQAAFREHYRLSASEWRRGKAGLRDGRLALELSYRPPYRWEPMIAYLAARALPGVETVRDGKYFATMRLGSHVGWIAVSPGTGDALRLEVSEGLIPALGRVIPRVRNRFDLDADPLAIAEALGSLAEGREGTRLPGALNPFETAVRAVLGQQVTVGQATMLTGKVAALFGEPMPEGSPEGLDRTFPTPAVLAERTRDDIASLGMPGARACTLIAFAQAVASGAVRLATGAHLEETEAALSQIAGFGPWTKAYIGLRALSDPDAFPVGDAGLAKALGTRSPKEMARIAERWRPWRGYAAILLWEHAAEGTIPP
ncbi:DNA-3-methyladenine glycosylase 2 [soil metagenome]